MVASIVGRFARANAHANPPDMVFMHNLLAPTFRVLDTLAQGPAASVALMVDLLADVWAPSSFNLLVDHWAGERVRVGDPAVDRLKRYAGSVLAWKRDSPADFVYVARSGDTTAMPLALQDTAAVDMDSTSPMARVRSGPFMRDDSD